MARQVTGMTIDKANKGGGVILGLRNACHIGPVGAYTKLRANAGLVCIHLEYAIGYTAIVAPYGGTDFRLHTNLLVFAISAIDENPSFVLYMATSRILMGNVRVPMTRGEKLNFSYIIDAQVWPLQDLQRYVG